MERIGTTEHTSNDKLFKMNVRTLKEWIADIPEEFDEFDVITRDYNHIEGTDLELLSDTPLVAAVVDEDRKEFCFLSGKAYHEFKRFENIEEDENNIQNI